jgi:hypothetical protein
MVIVPPYTGVFAATVVVVVTADVVVVVLLVQEVNNTDGTVLFTCRVKRIILPPTALGGFYD